MSTKEKPSYMNGISDICDKCGQRVAANNSVINLIKQTGRAVSPITKDRHIYPTPACEGSSRHRGFIKTDEGWARAYMLIADKEDLVRVKKPWLTKNN